MWGVLKIYDEPEPPNGRGISALISHSDNAGEACGLMSAVMKPTERETLDSNIETSSTNPAK